MKTALGLFLISIPIVVFISWVVAVDGWRMALSVLKIVLVFLLCISCAVYGILLLGF